MEKQTTDQSGHCFKPVPSGPRATHSKSMFRNNEVIRIMMVGKTGAGKSSSGNTILGEEVFHSHCLPVSITEECSKVYAEVDGQKIAVIDTRGLFDTRTYGNTEDIAQSIYLASPGPHVFLIVIRLGRFTEEEKQTVKKIQQVFGEDSNKYCMFLFTHGDLLKETSIEDFLGKSQELQELVDKCNGQYHVFNNNEVKDRSQVRELLKKIRKIIEKNGGRHYTTDMFKRAEKKIEQEKQRILKEKEEEMYKKQEELEKKLKEKYEKLMEEMKNDLKKKDELREAHQRELEEKIQQLWERQETLAREEAESTPILEQIWEVFSGLVLNFLLRR